MFLKDVGLGSKTDLQIKMSVKKDERYLLILADNSAQRPVSLTYMNVGDSIVLI